MRAAVLWVRVRLAYGVLYALSFLPMSGKMVDRIDAFIARRWNEAQ